MSDVGREKVASPFPDSLGILKQKGECNNEEKNSGAIFLTFMLTITSSVLAEYPDKPIN
jgi:hypothetical protein